MDMNLLLFIFTSLYKAKYINFRNWRKQMEVLGHHPEETAAKYLDVYLLYLFQYKHTRK